MGVYINMEMPNNCRDCPLEDAYEGYNCRIVEKSANWGLEGRTSWCPLVPVPPHGRLIDADELKTAFPCGESVRTECVRATIDHTPTVVPAEEGE